MDAALRIDTLKNCKDWLAQLPLTNARQAHSLLLAQMKLLNAATLAAADRLQILEALREPVAFVRGERAKRYCGLAMHDHNRIYRAVPTTLWQQFHKLYATAETFAVADSPVSDVLNHDAPNPSCTSTYVHALLAQYATPDALTLAQMATIERWLKQ